MVQIHGPVVPATTGRPKSLTTLTLGYSLRWSCRGFILLVWLDPILSGHAPPLTSPLNVVEAEALPSDPVLLSEPSAVIWPLPTSHTAYHRISRPRLYRRLRRLWTSDHMRSPLFHHQLSPHSIPPTPESPSRLHIQNLHLFRGLRSRAMSSALPDPLSRLTYRRCRIPFMVRTVGLHLLHRGILRFSTSSHPEALGARYSALWRLPRPDFHRLVDGDFKAHQPVVLVAVAMSCEE